MNLWNLLFYFRIPGTLHGNSKLPQNCSTVQGRCKKCYKTLSWTQGIFCSNFMFPRHGYPPCRGAWCGGCYTSSERIKFHIHHPDQLSELENQHDVNTPLLQNLWGPKLREENAFCYARPGDHLLSPFECDLCIFVKLQKRLPCSTRETDKFLLATIGRMNLDCFWSRESSTVRPHEGRT